MDLPPWSAGRQAGGRMVVVAEVEEIIPLVAGWASGRGSPHLDNRALGWVIADFYRGRSGREQVNGIMRGGISIPLILFLKLYTCVPPPPPPHSSPQGLEAHFDWLASALRHSLDMTKRTKSWSVIEKCPSQRPTSVTVPNADASTAAAAAAAAKSTPSSGYSGSDEPDILTRWLQVEDEPDEEFLRVR